MGRAKTRKPRDQNQNYYNLVTSVEGMDRDVWKLYQDNARSTSQHLFFYQSCRKHDCRKNCRRQLMMERLPDAMDACSTKKMGEAMEDEEEMNTDYMTTAGLLLGVVGLVCTWCVCRPHYIYSSERTPIKNDDCNCRCLLLCMTWLVRDCCCRRPPKPPEPAEEEGEEDLDIDRS